MDLIEYEKITRSEAAAQRYITAFCWKDGARHCPKCFETKVYDLSEGRVRCGRCRYTFHDLSRRWINTGGLGCQEWLRLVKLFELELTVSRMAPQLRLSYNTVYKAVTAMRFSILAQALDSRQLVALGLGRVPAQARLGHGILGVAVEQVEAAGESRQRGRPGAVAQDQHRSAVGVLVLFRQPHRLPGRLAVGLAAVRQPTVFGIGPQQRVQMFDPFAAAGHHHRPHAGAHRFLQQAGQSLFQRQAQEMVETDLGHGLPRTKAAEATPPRCPRPGRRTRPADPGPARN